MSAKKIITVFGATGAQGGGIISTFLHDAKLKNEWAVRGVTRDVTKPSAEKLASQGVEVVAADMNDKESLVRAMAGSHTVFAVTNYWESTDQALEIQQGKNLADASKGAQVQHFIFSSLYNITELTKGKLTHVEHFDGKAKVEEYVRELGIPASFFMPGFYMPNIPGGMMKPNQQAGGAWVYGMPASADSRIPLYDPADTGLYIKALVLNREKMLGKRLLAASQYLTAQEVVDGFKNVFAGTEAAKTAAYFQLTEEMFRGFMKSVGTRDIVIDDYYDMFRLIEEFGYFGGDSLEETRKMVEEEQGDHLTTWEEFAKKAAGFKDVA